MFLNLACNFHYSHFGNDRNQIALRSVIVGFVGILGDRAHRNRDARRIGKRQIALRRHWLGRRDRNLSRRMAGMEGERFLVGKAALGGVWHGGLVLARQPSGERPPVNGSRERDRLELACGRFLIAPSRERGARLALHGAVSRRQGRASRRPAVFPHGRFL